MSKMKKGHQFLFGVLQSVGGSLVTSTATAIWQQVHRGSVDWLPITALFIITCLVFFGVIKLGQRQVPNIPIPTPPSETHYRLKIHSAEYGAGKSVGQVDHYLRARATDVLYARVNADLFGGYDPASGLPKQLSVVYSFDGGKERTAVRNEHDLIVLPEDPEGPAALFSPLQIEAFQLAKDIHKFLGDFEPKPPQFEHDWPERKRLERITERGRWAEKLMNGYRLRFEKRDKEIELKFGELGIKAHALSEQPRKIEERIKRWEEELVAMAHRMDGVNLSVGA